jgi:hypothetical protein
MNHNAETDAAFIRTQTQKSRIMGRKGLMHVTKLPLSVCQSGGLDLAIERGWVRVEKIDGRRYIAAVED